MISAGNIELSRCLIESNSMSEEVTDNVELRFHEVNEAWSSHYSGFDVPISSVGESREEALANLTDAVASYLPRDE